MNNARPAKARDHHHLLKLNKMATKCTSTMLYRCNPSFCDLLLRLVEIDCL